MYLAKWIQLLFISFSIGVNGCYGEAPCLNPKANENKDHFINWYGKLWKNKNSYTKKISSDSTQEQYYKHLSTTDSFSCILMKSIGGIWGKMPDSLLEWCENEGNCETWPQMDGVKKICMDKIYNDVRTNSCLVYSFGLSKDWSFEEIMALMGCTVRAFDPTVTEPPEDFTMPDGLSFIRLGISNETSEAPLLLTGGSNESFEVDSLENIVQRQKDEGKMISLLKLDVEGYEFQVLPQLLQGSIYNLICQTIVEIHSDDKNQRTDEDMTSMLRNLEALHGIGNRIIDYNPNFTMGRLFSSSQYYTNFDITLHKNI